MRPLTPTDIEPVLALAKAGIYEPGSTPFLHPWDKAPDIEIKSPYYYYSLWNDSSPKQWACLFVVLHRDQIVGTQEITSRGDFRVTKSAKTGSWLGQAHHGKGIGTLMRQMVAVFGFTHLGAEELMSGYLAGNEASAAVSRKVGYEPNGQQNLNVEGVRVVEHLVRLTPETFVKPADPVVVHNAEDFRKHFDITVTDS